MTFENQVDAVFWVQENVHPHYVEKLRDRVEHYETLAAIYEEQADIDNIHYAWEMRDLFKLALDKMEEKVGCSMVVGSRPIE